MAFLGGTATDTGCFVVPEWICTDILMDLLWTYFIDCKVKYIGATRRKMYM